MSLCIKAIKIRANLSNLWLKKLCELLLFAVKSKIHEIG
jgi:hypothetical protein